MYKYFEALARYLKNFHPHHMAMDGGSVLMVDDSGQWTLTSPAPDTPARINHSPHCTLMMRRRMLITIMMMLILSCHLLQPQQHLYAMYPIFLFLLGFASYDGNCHPTFRNHQHRP